MTEDREPERTCVGCGETDGRGDLVRLVLDPDGEVVVDLRGRLPGRGAWVHPTAACVDRVAADPRRLARSLKSRAEARNLPAQLRERILAAVLDGLSLAARAGALVGGHDAIELAILDGRVVELIIAHDASERTVTDLTRSFPADHVTKLSVDKDTLGHRVGQQSRAAVALVQGPAFAHLRDQLRRLRSLG